MQIRASDLRLLDVINIADGRRLGNVYDIDVDQTTGAIRALILPGAGGFLWWGRRAEMEIPWEKVVKVGVDVILVEVPEGVPAVALRR